MGTSVERASAMTELFRRGESFGIKGYEIDGMDPLSVHLCIKKIYQQVLNENKGPILIEAKTYRYRGHSMSDAQQYRTKEEVEEYRKIDPISQVKDIILKKKYASDAQLKKIDEKVKKKIKECEEFAESSPFPDLSLMYDSVYEQKDYPFIKHKID